MKHRIAIVLAIVGVLVVAAAGFYLAAVPRASTGGSGSATVPIGVLPQTGRTMMGPGTPLSGSQASSLSCPEPAGRCDYSYNWGGYAIIGNGSAVTEVSGSWTVPTIAGATGTKCPDKQNEWEANAQWIGIDGYAEPSETVEQTGIEAQCFYGTVQYYAWYEMFPAGTTESGIKISPGDSISASVTYEGLNGTGVPTFKTHLEDTTTGKSFNSPLTAVPGADLSSAQWIEEAPYYDGFLGLTPVSQMNFTKASAVVGGVTTTIAGGGVNTRWIAEVDYEFPYAPASKGLKYVKADPLALNAAGNGFLENFVSTGP